MKKQQLFFYILAILLFSVRFCRGADGWSQVYTSGVDQIHSICQIADGGYVMAGGAVTSGTGNKVLCILRFDGGGRLLWQRMYGGGGEHTDRFAVLQTDDGGYVATVLSTCFSTGSRDVWLMKLDPEGVVQWLKTYGGSGCDQIRSICQTAEGGFALAGWTNKALGAVDYDIWVVKLDRSGGIEWQRTYGGSASEQAHAIRQTPDRGYIVAGWTYSFGDGSRDLWVLKLGRGADVVWQRTYAEDGKQREYGIRAVSGGGYLVDGYCLPQGRHDIRVLSLGRRGDVDWRRSYTGSYKGPTDNARFICTTADGGFILAGEARIPGGESRDLWLLKLGPDGYSDWQQIVGGPETDYAECVGQTVDGGYIVAGWTGSFGMQKDIWLLKLDKDGRMPVGDGLTLQ